MTQTDLGLALGISFQQVQKYEKGTNRIGAGRLHDIATVLRVPVSELFGDTAANERHTSDERPCVTGTEPADADLSNDGLALARSFVRISDARIRERVVRLVEELSKVTADCRADAIAFSASAATRAGRSDSDRA
jgi:transcriptional regulator with XRE-family HTH domain